MITQHEREQLQTKRHHLQTLATQLQGVIFFITIVVIVVIIIIIIVKSCFVSMLGMGRTVPPIECSFSDKCCN